MDDQGDAPVPPSCPAMTTWSLLHLATPAAMVPTPTSDTSLTEMSACGATFFRSWISWADRKSTRLNSSHTVISYAVFCLKKKKMSMQSYLHVCSASASGKRQRTDQ